MGRRRQHNTGTRDDSSATNAIEPPTDLPTDLPEDAPAWGKSLYTLITSVDIKVSNIQDNLQIATETANEARHLLNIKKQS